MIFLNFKRLLFYKLNLMDFKSFKSYLNKDIERLIYNSKQQALITAVILFFFISIPVTFLFEEKRLFMYGINIFYSLITFTTILIGDIILNKKIFKKKWTLKIELLCLFIIIVYSFFIVYFVETFTFNYFNNEYVIKQRSIFTIFCIAIVYSILCYFFLKIQQLFFKNKLTINETIKYISIDYKGDIFKLNSSEILLIEAYGNYIKIYLIEDNVVKKKSPIVVRQTLKNISELIQNKEINNLIKCHRSYIINLDKVVSINKDANNKQYLNLSNVDVKVPISKNKITFFKELILASN